MAQKILAARSSDPRLAEDMVEVQVDQVVLARDPVAIYERAVAGGLRKSQAEVAIAYDSHCVTGGDVYAARSAAFAEMTGHGILVARAGIGFPGPVHLERFASPGRLCVTDEPRFMGVGGIGMLTLVVPPTSLTQALTHATVVVRRPVSVQVLLTGRLRPFVCARDTALELQRRGLSDVVRKVEESRGVPVVLEFMGPGARLLSVGERSVLAGLAGHVGATAALFVGDERTEVFLRDQRRSKAHRTLSPDAGAPFEEVVQVDLGAVDPLLLDEVGRVRSVRDLAGQPVSQALLGGDSGISLRDLLATAVLLKSKRVPPELAFLVAVPSRQMLEVLANTGALADLIATGARLVEPDLRVMSGKLYGPPASGVALRSCDPEPYVAGRRGSIVASADTIAYAIATGKLGDPRAFKRPARVVIPRALPNDDVLVARKADRRPMALPARSSRSCRLSSSAWQAGQTLELVNGSALVELERRMSHGGPNGHAGWAVVCSTLDEVRGLSSMTPEASQHVRAVLAPYIPRSLVSLFSAAGIAALRIESEDTLGLMNERTISLPPPSHWAGRTAAEVSLGAGQLPLTWLAIGLEREWATGAPPPPANRANAASKRGAGTAGPKARRPGGEVGEA
jgi:aconitate hydratase